MSLIFGLPRPDTFLDKMGRLTAAWAGWFSRVQFILLGIGNTGTTAQRPTDNLWVGQVYLDTTLGKPIFIKSLGPTVWIDATGAVV